MKKFLALCSCVLVFACSNSGSSAKEHSENTTVTLKDGSQVKITYSCVVQAGEQDRCAEHFEGIRIITPSDSAANIAGDIVSGIFYIGSLGNIGNMKSTDTENLSGTKLNVADIIQTYAYPKYVQLVQKNLVFSAKGNYQPSIGVLPSRNYLIFDKNNTDLYSLKINFQIRSAGSRVDSGLKCSEESAKFVKAEWEQNNYAKVTKMGQALVDKCLAQLDDSYFKKLAKAIETADAFM